MIGTISANAQTEPKVLVAKKGANYHRSTYSYAQTYTQTGARIFKSTNRQALSPEG